MEIQFWVWFGKVIIVKEVLGEMHGRVVVDRTNGVCKRKEVILSN